MKTNLKRFSMFFISQTVSQMGSSMTSFALIIWAYSNTGQVMSSSILAICSTIPYIIISLFGGTIADRVSKKKIMLICDLIAALCSLSILIFSLMNILHLWILCIINIIIGFMNAFQNPASQITVSLLVEKEDYVRIGGIQSVVNSMVGLGTPLIAAGILSIGGLNLVIIIDLCTFCFAFFSLLCWIKIPELKNIEKGFSFEQIIDDMRECGKFIKTQKGIVWLMIIYSILKFLEKINKICRENKKVAMFIDMDGTITVYDIYPEEIVKQKMQDEYSKAEPAQYIIDILKEINEIPNIDLYILSLSKTLKITEEKKEWLKKYVPFIEEKNWIIITRELNEYSSENRDIIKAQKIKELK